MSKQGPIVVVDDDPDDQYLYQRTLERLKLSNEILFFDNGREALGYLQQTVVNPFIILCDINMPQMSGLQLRELMCSDTSLCNKNIPFVFMSTSAMAVDIEKAATLLCHGFFQKESSFDKHEITLRKIFDYWNASRSNIN